MAIQKVEPLEGRRFVRLPRQLTLSSAKKYLDRAYDTEPQPVAGINRAITVLEDRYGFWYVTNNNLQCTRCGALYERTGQAENHRVRCRLQN